MESKLYDGDVRGAIKLLGSDDALAPINNETYESLKLKHPSPRIEQSFPNVSDYEYRGAEVTVQEVKKVVNSFKPGSAGGVDSLRPQHLKDLINDSLGLNASNLQISLANLSNLMFEGRVFD